MFKLLHAISQDKLTALIMHYKVGRVEARVHRNKCTPVNTLKFDDTRAVTDFVVNYAILLPGHTWTLEVRREAESKDLSHSVPFLLLL